VTLSDLLTRIEKLFYDGYRDMKKVLALLTAGGAYLSITSSAFATQVNPCPQGTQFDALCNLNADNLGAIVGAAVTFILIVAESSIIYLSFFPNIRPC
jgi:hypothetical protein